MNKYGQAAIKAIKLIETNQASTALEAWNITTKELFGIGTSSQKKGCPKNAFLGLCETGLVSCIPQGNYTVRSDSSKNKGYAIRAVQLLKENPILTENKNALWELVIDGEAKKHNSQMDVVLALWKDGRIS
ncbi:hypothetical protein HQN90_11035 [Paenibacillus alba]|uniref:DUF6979 family protein n=1 Tax=Paenibacillus alba TaxID=1197127 RepID=UPI0015665D5C|nr:hypothetical protein [Paenibacillus alba]NQX66661.1 hypothetical protein [Paenibacillus alba]